MGRFVRSVFVVLGVYAFLMSQSLVLAGLGAAPGARAFVVGVYFAMELLCVTFIVALQQPFFPPRADESAAPASFLGGLWRALCLAAGLALLWLGFTAARHGQADAPWQIVFGGLLLIEAQRRRRPQAPVRPAMRALAVLFGLLQIYPGVVCVLIGSADDGAADRAEMLALGAAILSIAFGFVGIGLRGLLRPLPAPESFIEA